ncbi:MAG: 16S rRNA (guanine(966)-N(2))-methyltransferase RsmD [Clostridia bacterium]|nr:16S rRNA (guanine(966)-N(2))-methyltransferase RsmD [Clostridia bacterium]
MRIITGTARGVRLATLPGENTRPTSERAKEAVFSTLQFELRQAKVLDLFAGSGQMGLEALSRGAARAVFCDASKEAVAIVRENCKKTRLESQCEVFCMDYAAFLKGNAGRDCFDLVFLDPPYAPGWVPQALQGLLQGRLLTPGAKIVCETAQPEDVFGSHSELEESFAVLKQTRYGIAHVTILQYQTPNGGEAQ